MKVLLEAFSAFIQRFNKYLWSGTELGPEL